MRTLWSLTKIATEAPAAPAQTPPAQPVTPAPAPAPAPMPAAPVAPKPAIQPVNTGLPAQPAQKDEARILAILSGPEGKEMQRVVQIIAAKNGSAPEVKEQFDHWRSEINTQVAFNRTAIRLLGGNEPARLKWKEYVDSMTQMGRMDKDQHTGDEWGEKQQRHEDKIDAQMTPVLQGILKDLTKKLQADEAANPNEVKRTQNEYFISGLRDLFFGNTQGLLKKWKELLIRAVQQGVGPIPPSLRNVQIPPELEGEARDKAQAKAIRQEINKQLETDPKEVIAFLKYLTTSDDEQTKAFRDERMRHNSNRARFTQNRGSGRSTSVQTGDGETTDITDLTEVDPNVDRRAQNAEDDPMSALTDDPDSFAAVEDVCNIFAANPAYQPIIQKLLKSTKPLSYKKDEPFQPVHLPDSKNMEEDFNAKRIVHDAVQSALGQRDGAKAELAEDPRWLTFMKTQANRIPTPQGKTDVVKFRRENFPALHQLLKQWAEAGDPALGAWVAQKAVGWVNEKVDKGHHFPTMVRQMEHLTKTVLNELARQRDSAYRRWQKSGGGTKNKDRYTAVAQRYAALKYKINYALDQLRALQDGKIHKVTGKDGGEMAIRIDNDDPTKKGRIVRVLDGKEHDLSDAEFGQLSRIISPDSWVPDYLRELAKTDPVLLQKTGNLYKAAPEQAAREDACKKEYLKGATPQDRLAGYRKMMGNDLFEVLKKKPEYAQQLAGIADPAAQKAKIAQLAGHDLQTKGNGEVKKGGEQLISAILNGAPVSLDFKPNAKDKAGNMKPSGVVAGISSALGISGEDWYMRPPEYDPYNKDDIKNITATLSVAIDSVLPPLLHKKRQSMHRGRDKGKKKFPWVDPKAMFYWVSILNPYSQVAKGVGGSNASELDLQAIRRKTRLLYELVGHDRDFSEKHEVDEVKKNINSVPPIDNSDAGLRGRGGEYEDDNYDDYKFPGHLPPSGKLYHHGPGSKWDDPNYRRVWYMTKLKEFPLQKFDSDIKHFLRKSKDTPMAPNPEVETEISSIMAEAMEWLKRQAVHHTPKSLMESDEAKNYLNGVVDAIMEELTPEQRQFFKKVNPTRPRGKTDEWQPRMVPGPDGKLIQKFDHTRLGRFLRAWYELNRIDGIRLSRVRYASASDETFNAAIDRITDAAIRDMERLEPTYG